MNLKETRASIVKTLKEKQANLKSGSVSDDDIKAVNDLLDQLKTVDADIKKADDAAQLVSQISALGNDDTQDTGNNQPADADSDAPKAATPGEQFVRRYIKSTGRHALTKSTIFTMETKTATDTQTEQTGFGPILTQVDRNPVLPYLRPLTIANLFGSGTIGANNNSITYPVFGDLEGKPATVAEAGAKSQVHVTAPSWVTDSLSEIAAFFTVSDNMLEDLDYITSEINSFVQYNLQEVEEDQLLSGTGADTDIKGILNRDIQKLGQGSDTDADRIFKTRSLISNATGFEPDGVVINPTDYEAIRLSKDANNQYYGGGYFAGQYGNGGIMQDPPLWGLRTVVTSAIPQGTALVGAFQAGGKVFRKGGLKIESSNSHEDNFTHDKVTIRFRERLGLQVQYPKAFVAVTLGQASTTQSSK